MTTKLSKSDMQHLIAKRVAQELEGPCVVNLGIGIPTLVAEYMDAEDIYLHTENGLLGVTDVEEADVDPNLVNAGKLPVGEAIGASYFNSSDSFAMIRGGHVDVAILGALQVDANRDYCKLGGSRKEYYGCRWCNGFIGWCEKSICDDESYF